LLVCPWQSRALVDPARSWPHLRAPCSVRACAGPCEARPGAYGGAEMLVALRGGAGEGDEALTSEREVDDFLSDSSVGAGLSAPSSPLPPRWEADHGSGGGGGDGGSAPADAGEGEPAGDGSLLRVLIKRGFELGMALILGVVAGYTVTRIWPGFLFLPDDDDDAAFDAWRKKRCGRATCILTYMRPPASPSNLSWCSPGLRAGDCECR